MARRLIDSTISQSVKWNKLPDDFSRLLFILLIAHADQWGRGPAEPFDIKVRIIPGFDKTEDEIVQSISALCRTGLVYWYEKEGEKGAYYEVLNWDEHQNFNDSNRKNPSKYPAFNGNCSALCETVLNSSPLNNKLREVKLSKVNLKILYDQEQGEFINISDKQLIKWRTAYPKLNVDQEIKRAEAWRLENPDRKYTEDGRFIGGWLSRADKERKKLEEPEDRHRYY